MFRAVSLTKNDTDECKYSGYNVGFDRKRKFSVSNSFGRNSVILRVDISLLYILITKKDVLILGESPTQGLDGRTLTSEKNIQLLFPKLIRSFV